jgi:iron complex outermembrane receptor protein
LGFWVKKKLKISNSLYRSFRIPTYTELYYSDPIHMATPDLKPETSSGYTLSLDYKAGKAECGLRFFINQSNNLIDWKRELEQNIWISKNLKKGKYYGLDSSLSYKSGKTMFKIIYTFQKAEFEDNPLMKELKYHYYFPENSLSFMLYSKLKLFSVSWALKIEREKYTKENRAFLNIKASKNIGEINFFFEILNLFNTRVEKIPGLPESPRSYSTGLKFNF